jgi:hypothetical protein
MSVKITGTLIVEEDYDLDARAAVDKFFDDYGIDPDTIDGKGFIGTCDGCDRIILEGETYSESEEDEVRCATCIDRHQSELAQESGSDPSENEFLEGFSFVADSEDPEDEDLGDDPGDDPEDEAECFSREF